MEILTHFALSVAGMLLYIIWKTREHLGSFSFKILWSNNRNIFIWALSFMGIVSLITAISPDASVAIKTLTGLDVVGEPASYVMLGIALVSTTSEVIKTKNKKSNIN